MYIVTVLFRVHAPHYADFMTEMVGNAHTSMKEETGCHQFDVCESTVPGSREVFLYEVYESEQAFRLHLARPHFAHFSQRTAAWVAEKSVKTFHLAGGG